MFVSHAWTYLFVELMAALHARFGDEPGVYYWLGVHAPLMILGAIVFSSQMETSADSPAPEPAPVNATLGHRRMLMQQHSFTSS